MVGCKGRCMPDLHLELPATPSMQSAGVSPACGRGRRERLLKFGESQRRRAPHAQVEFSHPKIS
ncbi:unnamed protein product [Prunus brigantina]